MSIRVPLTDCILWFNELLWKMLDELIFPHGYFVIYVSRKQNPALMGLKGMCFR